MFLFVVRERAFHFRGEPSSNEPGGIFAPRVASAFAARMDGHTNTGSILGNGIVLPATRETSLTDVSLFALLHNPSKLANNAGRCSAWATAIRILRSPR